MSFIRPEFFDIFGIGVFAFITILSAWSLTRRRLLPRWSVVLLLLIGLAGLVVDSAIVIVTYLK